VKRRELLALTVPVPLRLRGQQTTQSPDGASRAYDQGIALIRRMQGALGGVDRLAAVRDVDWTISGKTWYADGAPGPNVIRRIRWIAPNIIRKDQRAGKVVVKYFFDGQGGWELVPDGGLIELKGRELDFVGGEARGMYPRKWLPDRDPRFQVTSGGRDVIRVLKDGGARGKDIIVDLKSGLPLQIVGTTLSGKVSTTYRRLPKKLEFAEWRTVGDIEWPQKLVNFHEDVKVAEITTTEIAVDVGLDPLELSRKPQA
jgi:hypothetical protein